MAPALIFHASVGVIGLVSGALALCSKKGGRTHRVAGTAFFIAMLTTAASGAVIGALKREPLNAIAGVLTIYLLATAWMAVRRREGAVGWFERGAFLFAVAGAGGAYLYTAASVRDGTAFMGGVPGYGFGIVVGLAAALDLSVLLRRGAAGKQRLMRHLWRMHAGFFVAVGSFFPGQLQFFPEFVREIRPLILLFIPPLAVLGSMLFWLARVHFTKPASPGGAALGMREV